MYRKILKIAVIFAVTLLFVILALALSLNFTTNTKFFKSHLNRYLKRYNAKINYKRLHLNILTGSLYAEDLSFKKSNEVNLFLKSLRISNAYTSNRKIELFTGTIEIHTKNKKGEKKKGKIPLIPIKLAKIEDVKLKINDIPIYIKKITAIEGVKGSFELKLADSNIKGKTELVDKRLLITLHSVEINCRKLLNLIEKLTGKNVKYPVISYTTRIEAKDLKTELDLKNKRVSLLIDSEVLLETGTEKIYVNKEHPQSIKANVKLIIGKDITINATEVEAPVSSIRQLLYTIEKKSKTFDTIFSIVKRGDLKKGKVYIKVTKGKVLLENISISSQFKNLEAFIPETKLTVTNAKGVFALKSKVLDIFLDYASIDSAVSPKAHVVINFSYHPIKVEVKANVSGLVNRSLSLLEKLPIPSKVLKTLKDFNFKSGKYQGSVSLKIYKKELINVQLYIKQLLLSHKLFKRDIFAKEIKLSYSSKEKLKIFAPLLKAEGTLISNAVVKIGEAVSITSSAGRINCGDVKEEKGFKLLIHLIPFVKEVDKGEISYRDLYLSILKDHIKLKGDLSLNNIHVRFENLPIKGLEATTILQAHLLLNFPYTVLFKNVQVVLNKKTTPSIAFLKLDLKNGKLTASVSTITTPEVQRLIKQNIPKLPFLPAKGAFITSDITVFPENRIVAKVEITKNGVKFVADRIVVNEKETEVEAKIQSAQSNMAISSVILPEKINFILKGKLNVKETRDIFEGLGKEYKTGIFKAHLNGIINFKKPETSEVYGTFSIKDFYFDNTKVEVSAKASGRAIEVSKSIVVTPYADIYGLGNIAFEKGKILLDMDVYSDTIDLTKLPKSTNGAVPKIPLIYHINYSISEIRANGLLLPRLSLTAVTGSIDGNLLNQEIDINIDEIKLCGIRIYGRIKKEKDKIAIDFTSEGASKFEKTIPCLSDGKEKIISGKYKYKWWLKAEGKKNPLRENSTGEFSIRSKKGRIYKMTVLAKLLEFLSIQRLITLRLPDLRKKGFEYNKIDIKGKIKNGVLFFKESYIDAPSMKIFFEGKWNFINDNLDLIVLVAPFKTIDYIISKIPIISGILMGKSKTLISFPVKISGPSSNPRIIPISPSAIGSGLFGIMKRSFGLPFKLIPVPKSSNETQTSPQK